MDTNTERQPSKPPVVRQPYIGKETMRPLARMIANRLLIGRKSRVGMLNNAQLSAEPEATKELPAVDKEGNH